MARTFFIFFPGSKYERKGAYGTITPAGPCLIRGVQADRGGLAPVLLSWRYSRRLRFIKRAFHYRADNSIALLDLSEYYAPPKYFQTAEEASQAQLIWNELLCSFDRLPRWD